MPNKLFHIRIPDEGHVLLREARVQALREGKTLGKWLTELLREVLEDDSQPHYRRSS